MAEAFHDPYDEMSDEEFDSYIATLIHKPRARNLRSVALGGLGRVWRRVVSKTGDRRL